MAAGERDGARHPRILPLIERAPAERADAARNRRKILAAAEEIVRTRGVDALSMDGVAAGAGVGVGTVYRRFGNLSGLVWAMLDEQEVRLQEAFLGGPPPLGPGAPPAQRVRAFLHAYADVLSYAPMLQAVAESARPTARYAGGAYAAHHAHLASLITEARPDTDAHYLADALLAPLAAGLFVHQRDERGWSVDRIKAGLDDLLAGFPELAEDRAPPDR